MEPRVNVITLGVTDMIKSRDFYERGLGWKVSPISQEDIVFFQLGAIILALYPRDTLAEDATILSEGGGFRGVTFAQNVRTKSEVSAVLKTAESSGGKIVKPAQDVFWGGHSGYFADPDGHLWEVAWNPHFKLNDRGEVALP